MKKTIIKSMWLGVLVLLAGCASDEVLTPTTGASADVPAPEPGTQAYYELKIKGRYAIDDGELLATTLPPLPPGIRLPGGSARPRWTEGRVLQIIGTNMVAMGKAITNASGAVTFPQDCLVKLNGRRPTPSVGDWFRALTMPDGDYSCTVEAENTDWASGQSRNIVGRSSTPGFRELAEPTYDEYRQVYDKDLQAATLFDPLVLVERITNAPTTIIRRPMPMAPASHRILEPAVSAGSPPGTAGSIQQLPAPASAPLRPETVESSIVTNGLYVYREGLLQDFEGEVQRILHDYGFRNVGGVHADAGERFFRFRYTADMNQSTTSRASPHSGYTIPAAAAQPRIDSSLFFRYRGDGVNDLRLSLVLGNQRVQWFLGLRPTGTWQELELPLAEKLIQPLDETKVQGLHATTFANVATGHDYATLDLDDFELRTTSRPPREGYKAIEGALAARPIHLAAIRRHVRIVDLKTDKPVYASGKDIQVSFDYMNTSSNILVVPLNSQYSRPEPIIGTTQAWIEPVDENAQIFKDRMTGARRGSRFAAGGAVTSIQKEVLEPGERINRKWKITVLGEGRWRYYVEFKDNQTDEVINEAYVEFLVDGKHGAGDDPQLVPSSAVVPLVSAPAPLLADLKVGDPAPPLAQGKYVQGEPVAGFEKGKAYVVEFWATWCGPCRTVIPHVNKLQEKYKDKGLVVIGQNVWQRDENVESDVTAFVKQMGADMTYRVALDRDGAMAETWMMAAGRKGIPAAFVLDREGKIAWIGHPSSGLDEAVEKALGGASEE